MPDAQNTATPAATRNPIPAGAADWRDTLPEDWTAPGRDETGAETQIPLRRHPVLAKYASKDEAIKALAHAQRLLGRKSGPASLLAEAPETAGPPASPKDYQLPSVPLPEDFQLDQELLAAFLEKAHELGLTDEQAGGLYAWFLPRNLDAIEAHAARTAEEQHRGRNRELAALRQAHGDETPLVLENARKAVRALGGQPLQDALESCGAAGSARIVQAFARIAPLVTEAALHGRSASVAPALTPQRLREMMRDPRYFDPSRRDPDYVRQVQQGFEALYPGQREA